MTTPPADPRSLAAHLISGQLALALDENTHPTDSFALLAPPAPTQTRAFARAVLSREHDGLPAPEAEALIDDRMNRGLALCSRAVQRRFCIAELALRTPILADAEMAAQRAHLADLAHRDHIDIRVLPYGHAQLLSHGFEVRNGRTLVESLAGLVELPDTQALYRDRFDRLWTAATPYLTWYAALPAPHPDDSRQGTSASVTPTAHPSTRIPHRYCA